MRRQTVRWLSTTRIVGNRLLSRRGYVAATVLGFAMLLLFGAAVSAGYAYWHRLEWPARISLSIVVIVLTPSVTDVRSLFMSYDAYRREWKAHH